MTFNKLYSNILHSLSLSLSRSITVYRGAGCFDVNWSTLRVVQDGEDATVKAVLQKYESTGQLKFMQFTPKTSLAFDILWRPERWFSWSHGFNGIQSSEKVRR